MEHKNTKAHSIRPIPRYSVKKLPATVHLPLIGYHNLQKDFLHPPLQKTGIEPDHSLPRTPRKKMEITHHSTSSLHSTLHTLIGLYVITLPGYNNPSPL